MENEEKMDQKRTKNTIVFIFVSIFLLICFGESLKFYLIKEVENSGIAVIIFAAALILDIILWERANRRLFPNKEEKK